MTSSLILAPPPGTVRARVALAVGTLEATGHRGLAVDARAFAARGVHGALIAAVTSSATSSSLGTRWPTRPDALQAQLHAAFDDLQIDAVKLGALAAPALIEAVADALRAAPRPLPPLVLDPELVEHHLGDAPHSGDAADALRQHLLPRAEILTANPREAELLTGRDADTLQRLRDAARALFDLGVRWPVLKAAAVLRHPILLVFDGQGFTELGDDLLPDAHHAGAGALLSAAITAERALGLPPLDAIDAARALVHRAFAQTLYAGRGERPVNPLVDLYNAAGLQPNRAELPPFDPSAMARAQRL